MERETYISPELGILELSTAGNVMETSSETGPDFFGTDVVKA